MPTRFPIGSTLPWLALSAPGQNAGSGLLSLHVGRRVGPVPGRGPRGRLHEADLVVVVQRADAHSGQLVLALDTAELGLRLLVA